MSLAGFIIGVLAMIAALTYVVRYHITTGGEWKYTEIGRHLMAMGVVLSLMLAFITFNTVWYYAVGSPYPGQEVIGLVLFSMLAGVLWHRVIVFEHVQHALRKSERKRK